MLILKLRDGERPVMVLVPRPGVIATSLPADLITTIPEIHPPLGTVNVPLFGPVDPVFCLCSTPPEKFAPVDPS